MFGFSFPFAKQISGVDLPRRGREYGRGRGTKGPKQIRLEIFSLFLVKPSLLGKVRSLSFICSCANEVKLISKGMSCISSAVGI